MDTIPKSTLEQSLTYGEYRALVTQLLSEGKTTGQKQSPELLEYANLNEQRMNRIEKTFRLHPEAGVLLEQVTQPVIWLTITEGWCGDASQIVPVFDAFSRLNPFILPRFVLRDEHPEIMDAFLTDGSRSIPKVIFVSPDSGQVLGSWGPRPAEAQALMADFKKAMLAAPDAAAKNSQYEAAKTAVHTWYAHDKTVHTQLEVLKALMNAVAMTPVIA